jgi:16S rRNA (guanine527-N7)-methyltransferase
MNPDEPHRAVVAPDPSADLLDAARHFFGDRLALATRYAELLMTDGVVRGLIGPREAPRIWDRHLLNCAALIELLPERATVADVGSGAGLPGIVLAIARPDLTVTLVEPLARRTAFLDEVVDDLGLTRAVVVRARAEDAFASTGLVDRVVARAVAPLDRLAAWCLPLTAQGGHVLAMKGASAVAEVQEHADAIRRMGGGAPVIHRCGVGLIDPPTTVVDLVREPVVTTDGRGRATRRRADQVPTQAAGTRRSGRRRP